MGAVILACLAVVLVASCARERLGGPREGLGGAEALELFYFESLSAMIDESDAVVVGTISGVVPGRTVGSEEEEPIQFQNGSLSVEDVLMGSLPSTITLEEENDGISGEGGSETGDHGVYFVVSKEDSLWPYYRLVNSQGRFLFVGGVVVPSDGETTWVTELAQLTPEELIAEIEDTIAG
jgi:hypothetical protein